MTTESDNENPDWIPGMEEETNTKGDVGQLGKRWYRPRPVLNPPSDHGV